MGSKQTSARHLVYEARTISAGRLPASRTSSQQMLPLRFFVPGPQKELMNLS